MVDIFSDKGGFKFSYDQDTGRIFKDSKLMPSTMYEPVFSNFSKNIPPRFSGILNKVTGEIITLSGLSNVVTDINSII